MSPLPLPLLILAATLPTAAALAYFVVWADQPLAAAIYGGTKLAMIGLLAVLWRTGRLPVIAPAAAPRPALREGLLAGAIMAALIVGLSLGPLAGLWRAATPQIAAKVAEFHLATPAAYLLGALALCVVHSLLEELYWRRLVFGGLCARLPPAAAHPLAGLAFAGHHVVIAGVYAGWGAAVPLGLVVGGAGVAWSLLVRRHGGLAGAWIAHACCDAALLALGWRALAP
jgi:membrane protease YdiL (CAAX protease family)